MGASPLLLALAAVATAAAVAAAEPEACPAQRPPPEWLAPLRGAGCARSLTATAECAASTTTQGPSAFSFSIVADLDTASKDATTRKPLFRSFLRRGELARSDAGKWSLSYLGSDEKLSSTLSEAGRGFELSALVRWPANERVYTFDDRTGVVFELQNATAGGVAAVPRFVCMEGDGATTKGQKTEWASAVGSEMVVGSFGKEYTHKHTGEVTSKANLWVCRIDAMGVLRHEDWTRQYTALREATETMHPGYMILEAVVWSPVRREWWVLPRRVSSERYEEVADETRGSNVILTADVSFSEVKVRRVGEIVPRRGYSDAAFVPGSGDTLLLALKSEEDEFVHKTLETYISLIDVSDPDAPKVLIEDELLKGGVKWEGIAFL